MAREPNQRGGRRDRDEAPEFADRLVAINRVSKTVKGGKRFGFAAKRRQCIRPTSALSAQRVPDSTSLHRLFHLQS